MIEILYQPSQRKNSKEAFRGFINLFDDYLATDLTFEKLTNFLDKKPSWLMKGKISKKWYGIRSRPDGEPSPIMKNLEDGLIICTGFYKNGILLAPACSKWVANEIKNYLF